MRYKLIEDPDHLIEKAIDYPAAPPYSVCLADIVVLPEDWITAEPGAISSTLLAKLAEHGYDHVPMPSVAAEVGWRLVPSRVLRSLHETGGVLGDGVECLQDDTQAISGIWVPVHELLAVLSKVDAVLFVQRWPEPDQAGHWGCIYGLATVSDLNRRAVRKSLFDIFLDLESELVALIKRYQLGNLSWIDMVSESSQVRILGQWELSRRREVEIDPLEYAMLPDLFEILQGSDQLRRILRFGSRKSVEDSLSRIVRTRNAVMHPVKTLVLSRSDAGKVARSVASALDLIERIGEGKSA